jgi:Zn-finger nucleic acid-binding protein
MLESNKFTDNIEATLMCPKCNEVFSKEFPLDLEGQIIEFKCPVCSSEVKELSNLNTETDEFKCFGCHLTNLDRRVRRLERQENKK